MKTSTKRKIRGLCSDEVEQSRKKHGSNTLAEAKSKSFIRTFLENLGDPVIRILIGALIVNLFFVFRGGDIVETVGIAISVVLATLISTLSERGSEAAFRRLEEECSHSRFRVWRDGILTELPIEELVVGDIVKVSAGEQIPADSFVIEGKLTLDQSMLTGESREVEKRYSHDQTRTPSSKSAVFRGSAILSGEGEIEVFSVGTDSFLGKISDEVGMDTRQSPLKLRLTKLARQISRLGYLAAILVALAYLFNTFVIDSGFSPELALRKIRDLHYAFEHLLHAFMLGLTVIVMAVPEGLPMMIAVVLSANIRRMIKDNVLVRKPTGIEAAGSMNILFTDKTGTLTEGKMSVGSILLYDGSKVLSCDSFSALSGISPSISTLYELNALYNTSALISEGEVLGGNSTERALSFSVKNNLRTDPNSCKIQEKIAFDSSYKYSAVRISGARSTVLVKGAPEKIISACRYAYGKGGNVIPFARVSYEILQQISLLTSSGTRVLCIAEGERMPCGNTLGELTFICALTLCDKLRDEARESVNELENAGIHVVMITGDNRDTAEYIAKECGILSAKHPTVLTSDELEKMDDRQLRKILPSLSVLARALPTDKSRLVRISQEMDLVVGMTGDGINDAPALKRADIGFAMGSGTGVAREAGDIIILDNNLSSIGKAVLYGRTIFKSIRKFITLQLTMNLCAVGISMIGPFIGYDSPVTVVQMLWINIIMDTLGGLAFAGEAPLASYMKERPKRRDEPILNRYMSGQIICSGVFTVGLYIFFLRSPIILRLFRPSIDNIYLLTAFFALFIFTSVFHCFNCRTDRLSLFAGISKNKAFISIIALVLGVQLLFVYLGGPLLRTAPLLVNELAITFALAMSVFPFEFLRKLFLRFIGEKNRF
ncbi:MAG: calcium-translocating P-type ATPase, PMCA-type [Clostridia bacterium]|nr:calcium-translocating P-type ATPase, PMCA-type [Clostridia bacterium]